MRDVRLIGADDEQLGVMNVNDALRKAKEAGLDLVEVAPHARPPVCRILDYGKFKYEQSKRRQQETQSKQKGGDLKDVRLTPGIGEHDLAIKVRSIQKFLTEGDKVRVAVRFRGREITHPELGQKHLDEIVEAMKEYGVVEKAPALDGKAMILILAPKTS